MAKATGLFSPHGQIGFVKYLFRKSKAKPRQDIRRDFDKTKIWMRKEIRTPLAEKINKAIYAGMPSAKIALIRAGNAKGFVENIAIEKYGGISRENLLKAKQDAIQQATILFQRLDKMMKATKATAGINVSKKQKKSANESRIYISNTQDAFSQILSAESQITTFVRLLERIEF